MNRSRIDEMISRQEGIKEITRENIKLIQLKKLNELLCRENTRKGFYSNLPKSLNSLDELSSLPFTTDEDLSSNAPGLLMVSQSEIQRVLSDATSGTTGAAKRVFYTEQDCENTIQLFMAGLGELIFKGSRTMICMPFSGPFGLGELIAEAIRRLGAVPLKTGVCKTFGELASILETERPDTFVGMPVQLIGLLRYCGKGSLERALVSGDSCPESVIEECERILGSRLFPHYGSREIGLAGAITCPAHSGMHLRENHTIAEIIDENGNVLPEGEYGELVVTTIGMQAMPLIRYKTGDITRIIPGKCQCGSEVIRLDDIRRKETEDIYELDNQLFTLSGLIDYSAELSGNTITINAITKGNLAAEDINALLKTPAKVSCRPAEDSDKSMYAGKRSILCPRKGWQ